MKSGKPKYIGNFFKNKFNGLGTLYNKRPTFYQQPQDHKFIGRKCSWTKYEGYFINGKKHGQGIYYFHNGDKFIGNFENDIVNGPGEFLKKNGFKLKSVWKKGFILKKKK